MIKLQDNVLIFDSDIELPTYSTDDPPANISLTLIDLCGDEHKETFFDIMRITKIDNKMGMCIQLIRWLSYAYDGHAMMSAKLIEERVLGLFARSLAQGLIKIYNL